MHNFLCTFSTVRKASRSLGRYFEDALQDTGVTIVQFSILRDLNREGPTPLSRLADGLCIERTSLYRTIQPLESRGAIVMRQGHNRKIKIAELTKSGQELLQSVEPFWAAAQENVVSALGAENWQHLSQFLLQIPEEISKLK